MNNRKVYAPCPNINWPARTDFRNDVKEEDAFEAAREVFLPKSQKWILLRRPKPLAYVLLGAPLPGIPRGWRAQALPKVRGR